MCHAGTTATGSGGTYTIVSGDTFSALAQRWGTTITAIQNANPGVNPSNLQIGQVINKPGGELLMHIMAFLTSTASILTIVVSTWLMR
jgi:LysM repeat protein